MSHRSHTQQDTRKRGGRRLFIAPCAGALFLTLLFSEPVALFGVEGFGRDTVAVELPEIQVADHISVAIDTSLGYRPDLIKAGLIYDFTENVLVWEKNLDQKFAIASLTKMMVALITMEQVAEGKISLSDTVTVSKAATLTGGSSIYLKAGQRLTLEELLAAAMVRSGNDAAFAVAEHIGGTEAGFVRMMNERAAALRMDSTAFFNPTGMPIKNGTDNYSTPADLLRMARETLKHEQVTTYTCRTTDQCRNANGIFSYENRNSLVKSFYEVDGLKTGFTRAAGYCVVASANRCGHRVLAIVLGAPTRDVRHQVAAGMFGNYYDSIGLGRLGEEFADTGDASE